MASNPRREQSQLQKVNKSEKASYKISSYEFFWILNEYINNWTLKYIQINVELLSKSQIIL